MSVICVLVDLKIIDICIGLKSRSLKFSLKSASLGDASVFQINRPSNFLHSIIIINQNYLQQSFNLSKPVAHAWQVRFWYNRKRAACLYRLNIYIQRFTTTSSLSFSSVQRAHLLPYLAIGCSLLDRRQRVCSLRCPSI